MADLRYYDIIDKPVITEKSMAGMEYKRYTFYVHTEATKSQIKEAVEKMFPGTKVAKVNTMNLDGKKRRDRKSTRLNSSHIEESRMPSSA